MIRGALLSVSLVALVGIAAFACNPEEAERRTSTPTETSPTPEGDASSSAPDTGTPDETPDGSSPSGDAGADGGPIENKNLGDSAGCGKAAGATGAKTITKTVAGKERTYIRVVPAGYDPTKSVALVFALHGSGGTAEKARASYDLEAEAKNKAIFVYPQGLPYDPKFPGDNRWNPTKNSDDYAFLDAVQADLEASHCIDRDRVFAVGFSNGARMTSMLGCYRGDKLRAIATVAPGGNDDTLPITPGSCVGEVALWGGLGTEDPDHEPGSKIVRDYYTAANGCTATTTATTPAGCMAYAGCRAASPVTWCSYPGGHAWPPIGAKGVWGFFDALK